MDWNSPEEMGNVQEVSNRVDRLGEALFDFHHKRNLAQQGIDDGPASALLTAVTLLECRQMGLLDAARACSMIGRPLGTGIILRSMYETFLSILLLTNDTSPIKEKDMKDAKVDLVISQSELADRFIAFGDYLTLKKIEARKKLYGSLDSQSLANEVDLTFEEIRNLGEEADRKHRFKNRQSWHPIDGTMKLVQHLWPKGEEPKFDSVAVPISWELWNELFLYCFTEASHEVHGNIRSISRHELFSPSSDKMTLSDRSWLAEGLNVAFNLTDLSLCSIAHWRGSLPDWLQNLEDNKLLADDASV